MKRSKQELDAIINDLSREVRDEQVDHSIIDGVATRVWAKISKKASADMSRVTSMQDSTTTKPNVDIGQIAGCEDFQSLIPAYLGKDLAPARKLLLEDHSSECLSCRREMNEQRALMDAKRSTYVHLPHTRRPDRKPIAKRLTGKRVARWAVPTAAAVMIAVAGLFMYERLDLSGTTLAATIESADGAVYLASDIQFHQLAAGEQLKKGQRIRTAKDSNAVLRLADGSTIEMRERSEFYVTENMRGVTIKLDRGDVIVEAAEQHNGRLYVQTPDSLVSVKGTIFAVESGTKGSRVSVVEGEVQVTHSGKDETLLPGDQTTTNADLGKTPVEQNVAWSRNAAKYSNLVSELAKLRREIDQKVARPGVRHTSKFIDLLPANTVFFAALPNVSETLAESQRLMQERIKQNPTLAEWWKEENKDGLGLNQKTMARIHEFGSHLGDEIVLSAELDGKGEPSGVLVLGQAKDAASFRTYLADQMVQVGKDTGNSLNIRIVNDPYAVEAASTISPKSNSSKAARTELFVWIRDDVFAASPQLETLRGFATTLSAPQSNAFVASAFHKRISEVYKDGAGLVVAADLEKIVSQAVSKDTEAGAERRLEGFKQLGVMNLRHFVVEQKEAKGRTLSRAELTFNEPDRGIASWLAAPGSMGALDFISPNANVAAAFVVKDPALLVDDLLGFFDTVDPDMRRQMSELEKQQGFDIRNDFAAPLGGEFAFAIDGPLLPTPSWKLIMEVYDSAKLQDAFERAVSKVNEFSSLHGKGSLAVEKIVAGERTYYLLKTSAGGPEVHYVFTNGYLVAAPSKALVDQALSNRDSGTSLVRSSRFMNALPQDGNTNFSAIFYHDLAAIMSPFAERMKNVAGGGGKQLSSIDPNAPPTLAYAYAQGDRITIAANTEGGAFGLSPASLIGLPHAFEMQNILMNAMGEKDVKKEE